MKKTKEEQDKQLQVRHRIAVEILDTELAYVENLRQLNKDYLEPLVEAASKKPILRPDEIKIIFNVIEAIITLNSVLATQLSERMGSWNTKSCVGDIFDRNSAFLKMYSTYVNGFSAAMITISKCKAKNSEFVSFLDDVHDHTTSKLDLPSYLIMPVQRLPRYVLLLTELLKNTPPTHPGYQNLSEALRKIKEIADFVNEAKRSAENMQQVLAIQDDLSGKKYIPIVEAHRRFDSKGILIYYSVRKNYKPKNLQYFLFNDLLVLCWPALSVLKNSKPLTKFRVKEVAHLYCSELEDYPDKPPLVDVVVLKATEDYLLGFNSRSEKEAWFQHYQKLRRVCMPRKEISSDALPVSGGSPGLRKGSSSSALAQTPPSSPTTKEGAVVVVSKSKGKPKKGEENEPLIPKEKKGASKKSDKKEMTSPVETSTKPKKKRRSCFCF